MKNLELFELQTAEVFKILYEVFPVPVDIYFHQVTPKLQAVCLFGEPVDIPESKDKFSEYYRSFDIFRQSEEYQRNNDVFQASMKWLSDSGYLQFERCSGYECFNDVVLTAKGLEVLKCTPASIDGSLSLGEKLQQEAISTSSDLARDLVKQALGEGLKLAIGL
ncbi:hypothetical protein [Vibrio metschnikovii]|uniref:hypothetical protein n=1 Tax=Vibrio metschnikovii TaxID=28172 RepID=UPI001C301925|nr:hypothetical protein [Vibrio metschnikovii]